VRVAVLGPLVVERGGDDITPSSRLQRRLLALLTLRSPRPVPVDALIDVAWPDGGVPKEPRENLQTHLSRLRRQLDAGAAGIIAGEADAYRLVGDRVMSDLEDLSTLTGTAVDLDGPESLARIEGALALWRGPSLEDIADADAAMGDAARLDELRLSLREARFEKLSQLDPDPRLVADLEAFTLEHPYRERPHAILMEILYHLGRQVDALGTYQRLRSRLADDLGLEPSMALRELEAQILGHRVPPRPPAAAGAGSAPAVAPMGASGPPAGTTSLVGREEDLDRLRGALKRSRLVTITGPGGVGKTRIAMEMGRELEELGDGRPVVWCDLTPATNDAEVLDVVAQALHAHRRGRQTTREAVLSATSGIEPDLLLDNCEHVSDAVVSLACDVLAASPGTTILATTRGPLDVAGEELVALEPMSWDGTGAAHDRPPAMELFWQRATATGTTLPDDEQTRASVARVCRAVDGLPLGIELAAAQLRNMTLEELADRVAGTSGALDMHRRSGAERHRSIRSALSWSLDALPDADRRFFEMLSVFPGSFDAAGAAAVTEMFDVEEVAARLRVLSDLCLVTVRAAGGRSRFRLLRTARSLGRERTEAAGSFADLLVRHRDWVVALAERAGPRVRGPGEAEAVHLIEAEVDNLRGVVRRAVAGADVDTALSVASAVSDYAVHRMRDDIVDWSELALTIEGAEHHPLQGSALATLAMAATNRGDLERARTLGQMVIERGTTDALGALHAHHALGLAALYSGALDEATAFAAEHLRLAEDADEPFDGQFASMITALAAHYGGDDATAIAWADRSRAFADACGAPSSSAWSDYVFGELLADSDPARSRSLFTAAITCGDSVHNELLAGVARLALATLPFEVGDEHTVLRAYRALIESWSARNDWTHQWTTLQNLVPLLAHCGAHADAAVILCALTSDGGDTRIFGDAAEEIAAVRHELGDRLGEDELSHLDVLASSLSAREIVERASEAIARLLGDDDRHPS